MIPRLTLILGGARSGKSAYAQRLAWERGGDRVLYVATAQASDEEMAARIAAHRAERPSTWHTLEASRAVGPSVRQWLATATTPLAVVVVDCLTLLVSNVLIAMGELPDPVQGEMAALAEADQLLAAVDELTSPLEARLSWIVVSNEVGMGLVPPYPLGRVYRDALGRVNQRIAAAADEVLLLVAGLPWRLKPTPWDDRRC